MTKLITNSERELLSQAIVETLSSWPALHRQVFSDAHYRGKSIDAISQSYDLSSDSVRQILRDCERRLRSSVKSFCASRSTPLILEPCYAFKGFSRRA